MSAPIDFSDGLDLSPRKDRSVLKKISKRGDASLGYAAGEDRVVLQWTVFDTHGRRLHSTDALPLKVFEFELARAKHEVVPAWEWVARSMLKGEQAVVFAAAHAAFGALGAPPAIPPQTDLVCEFKMVDILRSSVTGISPLREGEDILENAAAKVREGFVRDDESRRRPPRMKESETVIEREKDTEKEKEKDKEKEKEITPSKTNETPVQISLHASPAANETETEKNTTVSTTRTDTKAPTMRTIEEVAKLKARELESTVAKPATRSASQRFFDPSKHTLDPNREIFGSSFGHRWRESADTIEVDVLLPPTTHKSDLEVVISPTSIQISTAAFALGGALSGKVLLSSSSWALIRDEERTHVHFILDKAHGHRDIWACVFDKDSLQRLQTNSTYEEFSWL